jgi:glycosyltransferase involved in cell wall biosynthesis
VRYVVNATLEEVGHARIGPVAWDIAAYGGLLELGSPGLVIEALARRRRLRFDVRRASRVPARASTSPTLADLLRMPEAAAGPRGRLAGVRRVLSRVANTDVVIPPKGFDAVISHLRLAISAGSSAALVRTTTGIIPELWSWRPPPDGELVRSAHIAQELAFGERADRVICWTHYGADNLARAGLTGNRIEVAFPILRLAEPDGPELAPSEHVRAVFVSGATWLKGLPEALAAVAAVDDVELHVVGGRVPRDPPPRTHWHGRLLPGRVARLLASADVLLGPARQETLGVSILEGMRAGAAVIGSNIGTVKELVGHTGRLVAPGCADALTEALREVAGDARARQEMGHAAQRRYLDLYHPSVTGPAWIDALS